MKPTVIKKYLKSYAEPEVQVIDRAINSNEEKSWDCVVCIPLLAEADNLKTLIAGLKRASRTLRLLVIFIINQKDSSPFDFFESNQKVWDLLCEPACHRVLRVDNHNILTTNLDGLDIIAIDRFSKGRRFPEKKGVGLARKIICDVASSLIYRGVVKSPWIFTTDGDAIVSEDYFVSIYTLKSDQTSAYVVDFVHRAPYSNDPFEKKAIQLYDRFLHFYVDGLRFADSPYAFQTVGSTMVVHAKHYCAVRGFPKRDAGEDFYLLNKLAKTGSVQPATCQPIELQGRVSYRVPFGTGASVGQISELLRSQKNYEVYDPKSFMFLKIWLELAVRALEHGNWVKLFEDLIEEFAAQGLKIARSSLERLIEQLDLESGFKDIYQKSPDCHQRVKHFHTWFDAFRTLKFVHAVRDQLLPPVSIERISSAPF